VWTRTATLTGSADTSRQTSHSTFNVHPDNTAGHRQPFRCHHFLTGNYTAPGQGQVTETQTTEMATSTFRSIHSTNARVHIHAQLSDPTVIRTGKRAVCGVSLRSAPFRSEADNAPPSPSAELAAPLLLREYLRSRVPSRRARTLSLPFLHAIAMHEPRVKRSVEHHRSIMQPDCSVYSSSSTS
jgi:hypothetical protein